MNKEKEILCGQAGERNNPDGLQLKLLSAIFSPNFSYYHFEYLPLEWILKNNSVSGLFHLFERTFYVKASFIAPGKTVLREICLRV